MRRLLCVLVLLFGCAIREVKPTSLHPVSACAVSCPDGFSFRQQHMCRSGKRWFQDVRIINDHTTRGADGMPLTDVWITCSGQWKPDGSCTETTDFAKEDVLIGTCDSVIRGIVQSRSIEERGVHPGERDYAKPPN